MQVSKRLCTVLLCLCMLVSLTVTPIYAANAASEGLAFALNDDEQSYSVSLSTCEETDVVIPATYEDLPVTAIGVGAFAYSGLTGVTVPDSVTSIGNSAFENCVDLSRVTFGENSPLKTVGAYAFFCCSSLMSVAVPDSVTEIGNWAFAYSSLASVVIPDSVTSVGERAFYKCTSLMRIYYGGTDASKWATLSANANVPAGATVYYFSETQPTTMGNYWHYVDGVPMPWEAFDPGVTVIGTVTSFNSDTDDITIELFAQGSETADYTVTIRGNSAAYYIEGVAEGIYTIKAIKAGHEVYTATVTAADRRVLKDITLVPIPQNDGITVTCVGDIGCTVSGSVVTVDHEAACKVGYPDGGKYVAITAAANGDGTYSFTAPAGVTEVLLVVRGDANGDGNVNSADTTTIARGLLPDTHPAYQAITAMQAFASDVNNDDAVNSADTTTIARSLLLTTHPAFQALAW